MIKNPVIPGFNLGTLIGNLIAVAIIIAALLTFLYLVWGGIEWITSGGDKAGLEQARNRITNAFVGLVLVLTAWAIITLVSNFLGFPFPSISLPRLGGGGEEGKPAGLKPGVECQIDKDCRDKKLGKICAYEKCVATCRSWDNNPSVCYSHGESCNWTWTDQGAGKGVCSDKY